MAQQDVQQAVPQADRHPVVNIPPPTPLIIGENPVENWKIYKQTWSNYSIVAGLAQRPAEYQKALFLHNLSKEALIIFNSFQYKADEDQNSIEVILTKFDEHIIGKTNETYERYVFNSRKQESGESFDTFMTSLRTLRKSCNFCNCLADTLLRDRIVTGIREQPIRKRLLQESNLTLQSCIDICRGMEATSLHLKSMSAESSTSEIKTESANKVFRRNNNNYSSHRGKQHSSSKPSYNRSSVNEPRNRSYVNEPRNDYNKFSPQSSSPPDKKLYCKFCGNFHAFKKGECPAWGHFCQRCKKPNHFAKKCPARIHALDNHEELFSVTESVYTVNAKQINVSLCMDNQLINFQADSGATVNVIPSRYVGTYNLRKTHTNLNVYNDSVIQPLGCCTLKLHNPKTKTNHFVDFMVIKQDLTPLLGKKACEDLGLITVNYKNFSSVTAVNSLISETDNDIFKQYADVFDPNKIGNLPGEVHFEIDTTVTPQISSPNKIPISLVEKAKEKLDQLIKQGVIIAQDEPTTWNNKMLIATKKSGDHRVCLDPRPLNKALMRERYQLPVLDDVLHKLSCTENDSGQKLFRLFSKLDLANGYWHCKLDYESSLLTTFQTQFGRFRWLKLPFGTNVSSEIFAKRLSVALSGLDGVLNIADDIVVFGQGTSESLARRDHDTKLINLLNRCRERNIQLNKSKCNLRQTEILFLGHIISSYGLKIDPEKLKAVVSMPKPGNCEDVQRYCGFINYLSRFLPKLSEIIKPIRDLSHKDTPWKWSKEQDSAFDQLKDLITKAPILSFYQPSSELVIQCDASQHGLGSVLLQHGKPIAYASRSLTATEVRYAQIEKEMLAIVFSLEKFHQYTFGRLTHIVSDHKPLQSIMVKPMSLAPRRLQGMLLRAAAYNIKVTYEKGCNMYLADLLSRAYLPNSSSNQTVFESVNVINELPLNSSVLAKIKDATDKDMVLQALVKVIINGWPENKSGLSIGLTPYFTFRDELTVIDGMVLKGNSVLIPASLRPEFKKRIHSSHIGIDGCLRRAREYLFWPGITSDLREYISSCEICRTFEITHQKETLINHDVPQRPWSKVGVDLFQLENNDFLVTIDYYSNFFEIDKLSTTTSSSVIRCLKAHFARYGIPYEVMSDGGPQFISFEFKDFSKNWDFRHLISSPYNSKSNGKAENAVKTAKNLLRKAKASQEDQYLALLDFRNTPSQGLSSSPAQRLMSRRTRTLLPTQPVLLKPDSTQHDLDYKLLMEQKEKQSLYYDLTAKDLEPLNPGDIVRIKPTRKGQKEWIKGEVLRNYNNRSYIISTPSGTFRRNRQFLRKSNESVDIDFPYPHPPVQEPQNHLPPPYHPPQGQQPNPDDPVVKTRSGRISKPPTYLNDFER